MFQAQELAKTTIKRNFLRGYCENFLRVYSLFNFQINFIRPYFSFSVLIFSLNFLYQKAITETSQIAERV